jgi:hypothetical protein
MNKGQQAVKMAREFCNNNCFMCNFEITNENGEKEKICPVYSLREMEVTIDQVLEGFKERDLNGRVPQNNK